MDINSYDKIMENLREIKAVAETLSCLSVDEAISVESTKTLGYRVMAMSDEVMELLRSETEKNKP